MDATMRTLLFWKIRYFHRGERQFKDRYLYLDTDILDPATRAAVEIVAEGRKGREILKYRHLFLESASAKLPINDNDFDKHIGVWPSSEYFEDETGKEIPWNEFGAVVTGDPDAVLVRDPNDVHLIQAAKVPVPLAEVTLTRDEERLLAYFVRDVKEMLDSEFRRNGPGTWSPGSVPPLKTAVTEEEIRSFVMIFRRLYMTGDHDPASFVKAAPIFVRAMNGHPYGKWVDAIMATYQDVF